MKALFLIGLLIAGVAHAELVWENTEIHFTPHPAQVFQDTVFQFSNTGTQTVTLVTLQSGCGCLTATTEKRTYQPGETGTVSIRFNLKNRTGKQRKNLLIETNTKQKISLYVTADIPVAYTARPGPLPTRQAQPENTRCIRLTNPNKTPIKLHLLSLPNKEVSAEIKPIKEGFEYEIILNRPPGTPNSKSVLFIQTSPPPGRNESKILRLYLSDKTLSLRG